MVYWSSSDVMCAVIGGAFIALATTLNLLLYGRIAGLSGAFNSIIYYDKAAGLSWKLCLFVGLLTVPAILNQIFDREIRSGDFRFILFDTNQETNQRQGIAAWIIGGILVGWGTRMGNGCTSGHGVCGFPRFSLRSISATMVFMALGFGIATLRYYIPLLSFGPNFTDRSTQSGDGSHLAS
jgi:uncharacterized membrane protein YedE/YeeE